MKKIVAQIFTVFFIAIFFISGMFIGGNKAEASSFGTLIGTIIGEAINSSSNSKSSKTDNGGTTQSKKSDQTKSTITTNRIIKNPTVDEKMFIEAVGQGDIATAQEMINKGVDVNAIYPHAMFADTPLGLAISKRNRDMQQFLLMNHADVRGWTDSKGFHSYIVSAAANYDFELMEYLNNWGADVNLANNHKDALGHHNALTVAYTSSIYHMGMPYCRNEDETIFYMTKMLDFLVSRGLDVNYEVKEYNGSHGNALVLISHISLNDYHYSFKARRVLIKKLLEAGADANCRDYKGKTALDYVLTDEQLWKADIESAKLLQQYMK